MKLTDKKRLFAILWVDDWSSFPLSERDVRWFHQNAGPLSLGLEMDERLPYPFNRQFKELKEGSVNQSSDYLSHHYHPVRWKGVHFIKKLYDSLQLRWYYYVLVRFMRIEKWANKARLILKRRVRSATLLLLLTLAIVGFVSSSALLLNLDWIALIALVALAAILASLSGIFIYVHMPRHWDYMFSDWHYNRTFLQQLGQSLQNNGIHYPVVIRHGWCLPPASSMYFYLRKMGVLADASASPTPKDTKARKGKRQLTWKYTQPYYASLAGDYDVAWNGSNEEDRGILELPVNLGNIAEHGFNGFAKDMIKHAPDVGLASTYMHGWDSFTPIKEWVVYLKKNYEVTFVRADQYTQLFMKKYPRPILLNKDLKVYWALQHDGRLQSIAEADHETVGIKILSRKDGRVDMLMMVNTEQPIPKIGVESSTVAVLRQEIPVEQNGETAVMRHVKKGTYRLRIGQLGKGNPDSRTIQ